MYWYRLSTIPSYMYLFRRNQVLQQWSTPLSAIKQMLHASCKARQFCQRGPNSDRFFLVAEGRENPNTTKSGPSSASQETPWRVDDGPTLNAGYV